MKAYEFATLGSLKRKERMNRAAQREERKEKELKKSGKEGDTYFSSDSIADLRKVEVYVNEK